MLTKMRALFAEGLARYRQAGPSGKILLILAALIAFCLLCTLFVPAS